VNNGLSKKDSVTVTNTGTSDLIVSTVTSSNALFTATPATGTIKPGSTRKFYVTFKPLTDGLKNGYIYFNHNAENKKDSISVSGTGISPKFSVNPKSLDFGNVINGTTKMDSITVTNTGTANLIISSFTSSNIGFIITATKATILPGASQKFYITFTPLTSGFQEGYIVFNFNATNAKDSIHVTGTGVGNPVFPTFSVSPLSLDFGNVNSGTTKIDSVTITNTGTANLIIHSMTSNNVFYTINPEIAVIKAGATQKIYITFAPLSPGLQVGYIYFNHNATNGKDSIHVTGNGVGNDVGPKFSINILNLDFGTVFIGTSKEKSVIVTNTGTTNLIISDISSSDNHYIITPITGTIAPGESQEFFITFAPTVVEQVTSLIMFTHNAGKNIINATGRGLDNTIPVITISAARELPIGTEFAVEGIVTRTLGSYTRIQDATGALTIVQETGEFFNEVLYSDIQMGDMIRVQGRISEIKFLKVINGNDLTGHQVLSRLNELPTPVKVTLSELTLNGEKYESRLITLEDLTISSDGDITFQEATTYQTTDASSKSINSVVIRIGKIADTDMAGMAFIGTSVTFLGVLSQSSESDPASGYELTPVLPTDLSYVPTDVLDPITAKQYSLSDNYPNPFNSSTTIQYSLGNADFVSLKVFNILGKEVATLANGFQEAGIYTVPFTVAGNSLSLGSNVYYYRLEVGTFVSTKKMIIIK
jgi:hypothetical protein